MLAVTIIIGSILAFLAMLLFLGLWAARRFSKKVPASELSKEMRAPDFIQAFLVVVVCSTIFVVYQLAPTTALGRLLNEPFGLAAGLTLGCIGTAIAYIFVVLAIRRIRRSGNA
jgi:drug/metabolite transporter (DMT)-like permease